MSGDSLHCCPPAFAVLSTWMDAIKSTASLVTGIRLQAFNTTLVFQTLNEIADCQPCIFRQLSLLLPEVPKSSSRSLGGTWKTTAWRAQKPLSSNWATKFGVQFSTPSRCCLGTTYWYLRVCSLSVKFLLVLQFWPLWCQVSGYFAISCWLLYAAYIIYCKLIESSLVAASLIWMCCLAGLLLLLLSVIPYHDDFSHINISTYQLLY